MIPENGRDVRDNENRVMYNDREECDTSQGRRRETMFARIGET